MADTCRSCVVGNNRQALDGRRQRLNEFRGSPSCWCSRKQFHDQAQLGAASEISQRGKPHPRRVALDRPVFE